MLIGEVSMEYSLYELMEDEIKTIIMCGELSLCDMKKRRNIEWQYFIL
jgi:hypothetical protein